MSDSQDIIRELERAGWIVYESGLNSFTAGHADGTHSIKFGGKRGWNLQRIRRDAAEALGKPIAKPSAKRHRVAAEHESAKARALRDSYLATKDDQIQREILRTAVIRRTNELRDISRLMQPG